MIKLTLTDDQAKAIATACEFYARVKCGQFHVIPEHTLESHGNVNEFVMRKDVANDILLQARKQIYPELHGAGHSYGYGKFEDADMAYNVTQVIRHALGDERKPFTLGAPLPECTRERDR